MNDKITIQQMVDREVQVCLSSLVGPLAAGYGAPTYTRDNARHAGANQLAELIEQAFELASPIDDYEEAARESGWSLSHLATKRAYRFFHDNGTMAEALPSDACGWQNLCSEYDIEPYQREVFEFWAVSPWFAAKLAQHGEKVENDFAGMNVWARTTTGQAISSDGVIERIYADMMKA